MNKKLAIILFFAQFFITLEIYAQKGSYPNPAAVYCLKMGYDYKITIDDKGNQKGICILPDSSKVDAWDFYKGKIKQEYSYCVKKGYSIKTKTLSKNGFTVECPYCKSEETRNTEGEDTQNHINFDEIPMRELMAKNGEPLINDEIKDVDEPTDFTDITSFRGVEGFPSSFDWRNHNGHAYIGPIRDQGSCGSCYAFGAVACAEGVYNKATGSYDNNRKEFSESFIMWCLGGLPSYNSHFRGCNGADYAYKELEALTKEGICERNYFQYTISNPGSCSHWNDPKGIFSGWKRVGCNNVNAIKQAIMNYGIVDAAILTTPSFVNYSGGIYSDGNTHCNGSPCSYTRTNHAIALVGWGNDPTHGDYWILRNSWGKSWGESGYMRIKVTSARVACAVSYLVPNPVILKADNINEANKIPSGSNVKFIGHNNINLKTGFRAESGSNFEANITGKQTKPATVISINEFDKLKKFAFIDNQESKLSSNEDSPKEFSNEKFKNISIYPNPVSEIINIVDIAESKIDEIKIFNSNGTIVYCEIDKSNSPITIDVSIIPKGIYYMQIRIDDEFFTKKIVKQ